MYTFASRLATYAAGALLMFTCLQLVILGIRSIFHGNSTLEFLAVFATVFIFFWVTVPLL